MLLGFRADQRLAPLQRNIAGQECSRAGARQIPTRAPKSSCRRASSDPRADRMRFVLLAKLALQLFDLSPQLLLGSSMLVV